jgi:hypothetical protein
MDREVEAGAAAEIEHHVAGCAECQACVAEFRLVSGEFEEFCETVADSRVGSGRVGQKRILLAAAAALLMVAIFGYSRRHVAPAVERLDGTSAAARMDSAPAGAKLNDKIPAPLNVDHHTTRRAAAVSGDKGAACCALTRTQTLKTAWVAEEPEIRIAIPAEAMFPPGAVPEGVNFVADLSIGADGRAKQLRLEPRLDGFERRTNQP